MSLRAFHAVFIAVSAALCLWLVGWGAAHRGESAGAALAGLGAAGFVGLAAYLRRFLRKQAPPSNGFHPKAAVAALSPAVALALARDASACAMCMGQPDGNTARALNWGIAFLGALVLSTLSGIGLMVLRTMRPPSAPRP